ncbi:histidine kinase [Jeotgalibaca sp. MA1X17-3]|uniref:cache domain-containing sensor histidine kinase n=1 Tax=Jeotgalibaca sp. MA1X17-3 TaxID=2908211 RepID=UPI001F39B152|nr:sensor histidine kinase [Jeotgalibaca sp. MA1X17-3]UJF15632.1 histidine kinase [Jeotgalibaca sp. MA1X17-3]
MRNKIAQSKVVKSLIKKLRKVHIFSRLLLVFCSLIIIPTIFITLFNQNSYAKEIEQSNRNYLSMLTRNAQFKLEQEASRFETNMTKITQNDSLLTALKENLAIEQTSSNIETNTQLVKQQLATIQNNSSGIKSLILITNDRQYSVARYDGISSTVLVKDLSAFYSSNIYKETIKGNGYPTWIDGTNETSQLFFEKRSDFVGLIGSVVLSYQLFEPSTKTPLGVLVCCIYPSYFSNMMEEYSNQDGGNTYIVGENGLVEGIHAQSSGPAFPEMRKGLLSQIFINHQGFTLLDVHNKEIIASYSGNSAFPLHIVNLTYKDSVLENVKSIGYRNTIILIFVLIIGIILFYLTATSVSNPIKKLIRAMQRVSEGDFSATYKSKSQDEVGDLCVQFDKMVLDMQELIEQVYISEINQKNLELSEKNAQLNVLQMQISPHFLYNTLDIIRWQCLYETNGKSDAANMIEKFCQLLRMMTNINSHGEMLSESLSYATSYVDIINFRFKNKINLYQNSTVNPTQFYLPVLSLQPIIENSLKHAFPEKISKDHSIWIDISLHKKEKLFISITDNGLGMNQERLKSIQDSLLDPKINKENIGIQNINQRFKLFYGDQYQINIESKLGIGTSVTLIIPTTMSNEEGNLNHV